jgi:hypothetical protein
MNTHDTPPAPRAASAPVRLAAALLACAAIASLAGCANMEFGFANTQATATARGSGHHADLWDPQSPVNVWNAF